MTEAALKAAIESALNDPRNFPWLTYLCFFIFSTLGAYFGSYLKKKAENLATKEDIIRLTQLVETVRAQFERLNVVHRIQFEAEFKHSEAIWASAFKTHKSYIQTTPVSSYAEASKESFTKFVNTHIEFTDLFESARPFIPNEVRKVFLEFEDLMIERKSRAIDAIPIEEVRQERKIVRECMDRASDSIRNRLANLLVV